MKSYPSKTNDKKIFWFIYTFKIKKKTAKSHNLNKEFCDQLDISSFLFHSNNAKRAKNRITKCKMQKEQTKADIFKVYYFFFCFCLKTKVHKAYIESILKKQFVYFNISVEMEKKRHLWDKIFLLLVSDQLCYKFDIWLLPMWVLCTYI